MSDTSSNDLSSTRVIKVLALRGPNLWSRATALECWVEFPPVHSALPNWCDWLKSWLPALEPMLHEITGTDAASLAKLLKQITLHLQSRSDLALGFYKIVPTSKPDVLRIITQYDEEEIARATFLFGLWTVEA